MNLVVSRYALNQSINFGFPRTPSDQKTLNSEGVATRLPNNTEKTWEFILDELKIRGNDVAWAFSHPPLFDPAVNRFEKELSERSGDLNEVDVCEILDAVKAMSDNFLAGKKEAAFQALADLRKIYGLDVYILVAGFVGTLDKIGEGSSALDELGTEARGLFLTECKEVYGDDVAAFKAKFEDGEGMDGYLRNLVDSFSSTLKKTINSILENLSSKSDKIAAVLAKEHLFFPERNAFEKELSRLSPPLTPAQIKEILGEPIKKLLADFVAEKEDDVTQDLNDLVEKYGISVLNLVFSVAGMMDKKGVTTGVPVYGALSEDAYTILRENMERVGKLYPCPDFGVKDEENIKHLNKSANDFYEIFNESLAMLSSQALPSQTKSRILLRAYGL